MTSSSLEISVAMGLGLLVSLLAWSLVALRVTTRGRFDLIDVFVAGFGFVYGAGYAFVIYATDSGFNEVNGLRIAGHESSYWVIPALALICVLGCFAFAAAFVHRPDPGGEPGSHPDRTAGSDGAAVRIVAWGFLGSSLIASMLYARAYGGIAGFFEVADALRSGLFDEAAENFWSFLRPFGGLSVFATYLFGAAIADDKAHGRGWLLLGLTVSIVASSVTLLGWGGRVDLLVYWLTVVAGFLIHRAGVTARLLSWLAALAVAALLVMPPLTDLMNPGKSAAPFDAFFAKELSFPVESTLNSLDLDEHQYGADVLKGPVFLLPERVWGEMLQIRSISNRNSEYLLGDKIHQGFGFTIPPDFVTVGLHQFGLAGPLILAILWCLALAKLDAYLVTRLPRALSAFLYAHAALSIAGLTTLYADPRLVIARNFHFILGLAALLILARVRPAA